MLDIRELKAELSEFSVKFALQNIIRKGAGNKIFHFDGSVLTPSLALEKWEDYLLNIACGKFGTIRFYGGPPGEGKWYNGTVLSMLCDLILFDKFSSEKFSFEKSVEGRGAWLSA